VLAARGCPVRSFRKMAERMCEAVSVAEFAAIRLTLFLATAYTLGRMIAALLAD
jgi:hypothetical protein